MKTFILFLLSLCSIAHAEDWRPLKPDAQELAKVLLHTSVRQSLKKFATGPFDISNRNGYGMTNLRADSIELDGYVTQKNGDLIEKRLIVRRNGDSFQSEVREEKTRYRNPPRGFDDFRNLGSVLLQPESVKCIDDLAVPGDYSVDPVVTRETDEGTRYSITLQYKVKEWGEGVNHTRYGAFLVNKDHRVECEVVYTQ